MFFTWLLWLAETDGNWVCNSLGAPYNCVVCYGDGCPIRAPFLSRLLPRNGKDRVIIRRDGTWQRMHNPNTPVEGEYVTLWFPEELPDADIPGQIDSIDLEEAFE